MVNIILSLVYLLMLICETKSINCILCSNLVSLSCGDPFSLTESTNITVLNQIYCRKTVSVTGIINRNGSGSTCLISDIVGITSVYCCSDRDYCNKTTNITQSSLSIILLFLNLIQFIFCFY